MSAEGTFSAVHCSHTTDFLGGRPMNQERGETGISTGPNRNLRHRENQACCAGNTAARMRFACNAARRQAQGTRSGRNN